MGMSMGGGKGGPNSTINMTPMIDILLVLLIIFMVITPLVPKGLDALVPQPNPNKDKQQKEPDDRTVVVSIDSQHHLKVNQDPVTADELGPRLLDIFKTRAERVIFVKGDPDVFYGDVAGVIDIAKGAQIDKVGLITENLEEGK